MEHWFYIYLSYGVVAGGMLGFLIWNAWHRRQLQRILVTLQRDTKR